MRKYRILAVVLCVFLLTGCANSADSSGTAKNNGENAAMSIVTPPPAPNASSSRPTRSVTTTVTLADGDIKIEGAGANASGSTLTVTEDGVYEISGTLLDGQIIINAPDNAVVELVLSGVNISNSKNSAIYCKNCDDFIITLTENTQNVLSDAKSYTYENAAEQEPNAALFSKTDMNIGGSGWLTVNANYKHGISSKDDIVIEGGGYTVTAAVDAIRSKDSLVILNGKFELNAGGDGLQASNMGGAELGYAQLVDGEYIIKAGGDAIQAETTVTVSGGIFDITTEGGLSGITDSQKGLKAGTLLMVENGTFNINSRDDALHSDIDTEINGGTFYIETGDDGIHANRNLYINGGDINIPKCYEGFEGTVIEVNGGKSFINASNDAISAAAGTQEAESFGGRGGNPNVQAWFNGGEIEAVSGGDTVDSNGNIYVTGSTLRLSSPPYPDYEGSLLCNGDVTISGGNLAAVGCMGVNVYWEEQPVLWFSHANEIPEGTVLSIRDESGKVLLELIARDNAVQSSYTSPEFKVGEKYALYIDGEKRIDVTLQEGMNALGDDGGRFTGGYSRGNMAAFN